MHEKIGILDTAFLWFEPYLADRTQRVSIAGNYSSPTPFSCGVPQGSVLGPVLFCIYTLPVADIIRAHDTGFHLYADDTQVYLACECLGDPDVQKLPILRHVSPP